MQVSREQMAYKKEKNVFWLFLIQITTMNNVMEERFRKNENEEFLKIFPVNTV